MKACQRCKSTNFTELEGKYIEYKGENAMVCPQCYEEIRQENINNIDIKSNNNDDLDLIK